MNSYVEFFEGVDPAPSDSQRSDQGAMAIAAATPRVLPERWDEDRDLVLSDNPADWWFEYCYARVLTHQQKASARQWSGIIHQHHQRFGLARICMDAGAGGGGVLVARELRAPRQLIDGVETEVTPICDQVDGPKLVARGDFILHLFKRGDPGIERVWPNTVDPSKSLAGDELLKDALYASYKEALDGMLPLFPSDESGLGEWLRPEGRAAGWPEERVWALKNLAAATTQLQGVMVATHEDGTQIFTKRGARVFSSLGRDDIAWACMLAYAAFLIWLRSESWRSGFRSEDEAGFSGSAR